MHYVKDNTRHTLEQIRRAHPDLDIPEGADLTHLGYASLPETQIPPPYPLEGHRVVPGPAEEYAPNQWRQTWIQEPLPEPPVPESVRALQGMRAVKHAGLVQKFLDWKITLDPVEDFEVIAFLDKAEVWRYDDQILNEALTSFGEIARKDDLFKLAASL